MKRRLLLLALLLGAGACAPDADREPIDFIVPVTAADVVAGTVEDRIVATGTLRAPQVVTLVVETPGALQIMNHASGRRLQEGDSVRAGELIAQVTGEDVRVAARRAVSEQRLQAARLELEAGRQLRERGLNTAKDLENLQAAYEDAKLEFERSVLSERRNQLVTPIDGVILQLARNSDGQYMANGQLVPAGQLIARVGPTAVLIADVDLVGRDLARARPDIPARVSYHGFDDREFAGVLRRFAPAIDERTRALKAEVEVDNPTGELRPGMFVEVELIVERREGVPVVPRSAVTVRGGERVVFLINGQQAHKQAVALGLGNDAVVEVLSGVNIGDRIVVSGLETLADQTRVRESGT